MEETILDAISQVGFPIAVSIFVLVRLDKKLDQLNKTLREWVDEMRRKNKD